MRKNEIEERKQVAELMKKVEHDIKPSHCLLCGKNISSCCNSHVVPQFVLKGIAENGMVRYGQSLNDKQSIHLQTLTGIKNAFTFKLICNECDNKMFSNYEKPEVIEGFDKFDLERQKKILTEMAIKSHLSHIQMKLKMKALNNNVHPGVMEMFCNNDIKTAYEIDLKEHKDYISHLKTLHKKSSFPFVVLFNKLYDYKMNLTTQTIISYIYDLDGNQIYNPKDVLSSDITKYFYLMILPFKDKTRVIFYIEKKNIDVEQAVVDGFCKLSDDEKLHFLFISLIIHDEQFYIKPALYDILRKDRKLSQLYTNTDTFWNYNAHREIVNFRKYKNYLEREQQK